MCSCPTSIVVFPIAACRLHGSVTACSSPAQLADAVPTVHVQSASAIAVAQARASLCKANSHTFKCTPNTKQHSLEMASLNSFFPFAFGLFLYSHSVSSHLERTLLGGRFGGGDHSMGRAASGSPRRSSQHNLTHCTQGMVSFRGALRYSCFIGCKSKAAHCPLSPSKHLLCKTSTQGYLSCIWG